MGKNAIFDFFYHITAMLFGDGNYSIGVALGIAIFVVDFTVFLFISGKALSFILRKIRRYLIEGAKK